MQIVGLVEQTNNQDSVLRDTERRKNTSEALKSRRDYDIKNIETGQQALVDAVLTNVDPNEEEIS
jgi:hypothetical protein